MPSSLNNAHDEDFHHHHHAASSSTASVPRLFAAWAAGELKQSTTPPDPDTFLFPRMLLVTGPYHQVWNAYRSAVESNPDWESFRPIVAIFLPLIGNKPLRQRFIVRTMSHASPEQKRLFENWPYSVVDWKWGYMEDVFARLSAADEVFFEYFDIDKFKTPSGHAPADHTAVDLKGAEALHALKPEALRVAAEMEGHAVFSRAIGICARWFTGCSCHDHIWSAKISDHKKQQLFERETGGLKVCAYRGKRAWELARGHWKTLISDVAQAQSERFQIRVGELPPQQWFKKCVKFQ